MKRILVGGTRVLFVISTVGMMAGNAGAQATATADPTAAGINVSALPSLLIEELTWVEIRAAIDSGRTAVIVPIGGTEQNGPHMVMGKHNFIITHAATVMASRLGNALVAPSIQFVPEGNYSSPNFGSKPGVITNPGASYTNLLEAAARSLEVHGFMDVLFIGDSGGNQGGMTSVAEALNAEWEAAGRAARVFSLNDYYAQSRDDFRAWLLAEFGYDDATVGSHAGISDTSQMLWVHPEGIRSEKRAPGGGSPDAGVTGDPTLATADIGRMGIEFKVNAAIAQYRALKRPAGRGGRGGRGGGSGG